MLTHLFSTPQPPARVVILGEKGFLASALAAALQEAGMPFRTVGRQEVDLIDSSASEKLRNIVQPDDALVIVSALTPDKGRDTATLMRNLQMASNLCGFLGDATCSHVLYISSDAVYDYRSSLIEESSGSEPSDLFALMHTAREKMLRFACQAKNVPLAIVRPCPVYGPRDTHNSYGPNRFIRTAMSEGVIRLFGQGEEKRDHVHVDDVAAILKLCLVYRSSGVVNAVSGQSISFMDLAKLILAASPRAVKLEFQPRGGPITHRHFDIRALIHAFPGFRPRSVDIGIPQVLAALSRTES
jgi:nucleoside-diphosphate-sugar epimerase